MADGRTDIINSCKTCFPSHIRVLSKRIKRGYGIENGYDLEWLEKRFLYHIRVLSFWIKRGYDLEWLEKRFIYHIRVLSFWIKRGYDLEWLEKRFIYHIRVLSFWIKRGLTWNGSKSVLYTISAFYPFG